MSNFCVSSKLPKIIFEKNVAVYKKIRKLSNFKEKDAGATNSRHDYQKEQLDYIFIKPHVMVVSWGNIKYIISICH